MQGSFKNQKTDFQNQKTIHYMGVSSFMLVEMKLSRENTCKDF